MKKSIWIILALFFTSNYAFADRNFSTKPTSKVKEAAQQAAPAVPSTEKLNRNKMKELIAEKKKELNGSEWKVEVSSLGKALGPDTLTFQNNQVTCKTLSDKGYPATNYTVSIADGSDMTTWETMQTNPKGGVMFIRGEWSKDVMRGVMSEQIEGGKSADYQFSSVGRETVPTSTEKAEEPKSEALPASAEVVKPAESASNAAPVAAFEPGTTEEIKK